MSARLNPELRKEIDDLMAKPVRGMPAVVVVGDDDVIGFTPAPQPAPRG